MKKYKILNVVGARPNFIKIAPLLKEMRKHNEIEPILVHTGQHYDKNLNDTFFQDLDIPKPHYSLEIGSDTHAKQTAKIMIKFEEVCLKEKPHMILVVGDVNSTLAAALVAKKLLIPLAHVEAGLRSFDRTMPEEINRIVTDVLSDYLFVSEESGIINLKKEGIPEEKIFFVGNVMIDSLIQNLKKFHESSIDKELGLTKKEYLVLTLHRPSNVDNPLQLTRILKIIEEVQKEIKIVFPIHPRTKNALLEFNLMEKIKNMENLIITEPLGYIKFISLIKDAKAVLTDSGGIQEETTYFGIPCITLRKNTERPITVQEGTNILIGNDLSKIQHLIKDILNEKKKKGKIPSLWDGKASERIIRILVKKLKNEN